VTVRLERKLTTSDTDDGWMVRVDGVPFTGEVVDTEDGQVMMVTTYENGIEHGPWWEIYPDGARQGEGTYDHGATVGEWRTWYPGGKLQEFNLFDRWGSIRKIQRWDEQGNLVQDTEHPGAHGGEW
jgi:antitoxin component YwqK of YwqJK toxin-antitoxin module